MIQFTAVIKQFDQHSEKTSWSYVEVPVEVSEKLKPGYKKAFRVKGTIDAAPFAKLSLTPMGGGQYILTVNATIRTRIRKAKGAWVQVCMEVDNEQLPTPPALLECLEDEPEAAAYFNGLTMSHRNYFINWLNAAKTDETLAKRIAQCIDAFHKSWNYGEMIRAGKSKG